MDPTSLQIFLTVAEQASVTRAAKQLGRVPSNVSTRLQSLEEQLGVLLFSREGKKMTLTREGHIFVAYAKRIVTLASEARLALRQANRLETLRVGTMESTAASRLPPVLARFNEAWPQVSLRLTLGATQELTKAVIADELDCALVAQPADQLEWAMSDRGQQPLHATRVYQEELLLILPPNHPPVRDAGDIQPTALAALEPGCTYRRIAERWVRLAADVPTVELTSYHSILAHVAAGNAVGVIPRSVLDGLHWAADISVHPLGTVDTLLISRKDRRSDPLLGFEDMLLASTPGVTPSLHPLS
ncbi:LysR substrate-binding domain-containing protein [Rhizobium sp. PL01]|uniref:LysR substrate-binding domain-containing protein n=1 Tax=Rhizobium sp. PL01 TaxID=3085631 RepID=UPI002980F8AA|nr:LysR substrate-binding domain-containing protein [Rhizobium sp. PL01]MDW5317568.1 LysR substrate-binding domain-containing protein [Rhizobium sp. PL01]